MKFISSSPFIGGSSLIPFRRNNNSVTRLLRDDFFDDLNEVFTLSPSLLNTTTKDFYHRMSINFQDKKDNYEVIADIPGVKKEDIDIQIKEGVLTVKGVRKSSKEMTTPDGMAYSESVSNNISRSVSLPSNIDEEHITAKFEDGELVISIPKTSDELPKSRTIKLT